MTRTPTVVLSAGLAAGAAALLLGVLDADSAITNAVLFGAFHVACAAYGYLGRRPRAIAVASAAFVLGVAFVGGVTEALIAMDAGGVDTSRSPLTAVLWLPVVAL